MSTNFSLKLLVNKETNMVLFAEAQKDFVDFLFSLLAILVGTIVQLLKKEEEGGMVGSMERVHLEPVQSLGSPYLQPSFRKESLLDPVFQGLQGCFLLLGGGDSASSSSSSSSTSKQCYKCRNCYVSESGVTDTSGTACPHCRRCMDSPVKFTGGDGGDASGSEGVVKEVITYMVMDDLGVAPMSTISSIALLNEFNVKEVGSLEERVVDFGINEGLKLLKASLMLTTVLSDVFLVKKSKQEKTWTEAIKSTKEHAYPNTYPCLRHFPSS